MKKASTKTAQAQVEFSVIAPEATSVYLAGSFNNWDPGTDRLELDHSKFWTTKVALAPGQYEYKFVIDGRWFCDAGCESHDSGCPKCVPNVFGTMNRTIAGP